MRLALSALLFLTPALALAQDPVPPALKLPTSVKTPVGKLGKLRAETTGKYVRWIASPGLDLDPTDNGRTLYYTGLPGTYELRAYTAAGDVPSEAVLTTVTIGDGGPPGPLPPAPPIPPPQPVDALKSKLKDAFAAAVGSPEEKAEWAKDLAALYRSAKKTCADKKITTTTQLKAKFKEAATALLDGDDALREVRQVVALELAAILPPATEDVTDDQRAATAALFTRLAAILEGM